MRLSNNSAASRARGVDYSPYTTSKAKKRTRLVSSPTTCHTLSHVGLKDRLVLLEHTHLHGHHDICIPNSNETRSSPASYHKPLAHGGCRRLPSRRASPGASASWAIAFAAVLLVPTWPPVFFTPRGVSARDITGRVRGGSTNYIAKKVGHAEHDCQHSWHLPRPKLR